MLSKDEIIHMAREAGFDVEPYLLVDAKMDRLERFASLVAAHEREKLVPKVAPDGRVSKTLFTIDDISKASEQGYQSALIELVSAVLAEREECAKLCLETDVHPDHGDVAGDFLAGHIWGCEDCAAAIRARSNNG